MRGRPVALLRHRHSLCAATSRFERTVEERIDWNRVKAHLEKIGA